MLYFKTEDIKLKMNQLKQHLTEKLKAYLAILILKEGKIIKKKNKF